MPRKKDVAVGRRLGGGNWEGRDTRRTTEDEECREGGGIVAPGHGRVCAVSSKG
jgi:hypothetical protein